MSRLKPFVLASLLATSVAACKSDGGGDNPVTPDPTQPVAGFAFRIEQSARPTFVAANMAGANYLFDRDRFEGTYGTRARNLGVSFIRWPGGAMAEDHSVYHDAYFHGNDSRDWDSFHHDEPWSLADALRYTQDESMDLMVVLPVKKYDLPGGVDHAAIRAEIGPFVREATTGRFGSKKIDMFEIGNEFYWGLDQMEAETYTEIARSILSEVRAHEAYHVDVAVQGGRLGNGEIGRVAAGFTSAEKADIDYLADHIYARNSDWTNYLSRFDLYRNNWGDIPLLISEWNVKATQSADPGVMAWGIEQAAVMVQIWDAMVNAGTSAANFWAVQQNTKTSAYPLEGDDPTTEAFIGGETLKWLADTVGYERYDVIETGQAGMMAFAYRAGADMTVFLAGLEAGEQQVVLEFPSPVTLRDALRMSGERDVHKQVPQLQPMNPYVNGSQVTLTVNRETPQELIRIDVTLAP